MDEELGGGLHRQQIAVGSGAADHDAGDGGDFRVAVQLVACMNVRDVDLDDGTVERLQRIDDGDGREGVAGGIDDDRVGRAARLLDEIDQGALVIGLMEGERHTQPAGEVPARRFDHVERGRAVDVRLAHAEQVEVRAIEQHQAHEAFLHSRRLSVPQ